MTKVADFLRSDGIAVIYDGDCPFCSAYVSMVRLREAVGMVRLVDARRDLDIVEELAARGLSINDGMIAIHAGNIYSGGDAVHLLALLASPHGLANRFLAAIMREPLRARRLYPYLRGGRNLALRMLARTQIDAAGPSSSSRPAAPSIKPRL